MCRGQDRAAPYASSDFPMRGNAVAVGEEQLKSWRSGVERKMGCARLRLQHPLLKD